MKNAEKGIAMGVINTILTIILPFCSRTVLLYFMGVEYLGLNSLFTSILNVLNLSELGFGMAVTCILYEPIAQENQQKINAVLKFYRMCCRMIGMVILVLGIAIIPFLPHLIQGSIPADCNLVILYLIYLSNTVISYFMYAYKRILLSAYQLYHVEVNIGSVCLLLQYTLQIVLVIIFKNYYLFAVMLPAITIINNIICSVYVKRKFPDCKCEGQLEKGEITELKKKVVGAFCVKIGNTVYNSADNIIISAFLGLSILGIYGNYYYIIAAITAFFSVIHNAIRPVIGNRMVVKDSKEVWTMLRKQNDIYMWFAGICSICFLVLFQDFITIWVGAENKLTDTMVVLLGIYFYVGRVSGIISVYQEAAGILWNGKFMPLISAMTNLAVNIVLVHFIGLPGVVISSILSSLFISFPTYLYIVFKHYFKDFALIKVFVADILKNLVITVICGAVILFAVKYITVSGIAGLILKAIVCFIIPNLVYYVIVKKVLHKDFAF